MSATVWIITFPNTSDTYTFTTGDLTGSTVTTQDFLLYTPSTTTFELIGSSTSNQVVSVNGESGVVVLDASDVGAVADTATINGVLLTTSPTFTASTTVVGMVELATDAEAIDQVDSTRAITPSNLNAVTATEARRGLIERATTAETVAGTDTTRAVTPAGVAAAIAATPSGPIITDFNLGEIASPITQIQPGVAFTAATVFVGGVPQLPGAGNAYTIQADGANNLIAFTQTVPAGAEVFGFVRG